MLREILILGAAFLGIVCGYILSLISPEEMAAGRKYFFWLKRVFFVLMGVYFFYFTKTNFWYLGIVFLLLFYLNFIRRQGSKTWLEGANIILWAGFFFLMPEKTVFASLIFLYGLPAGSSFGRKK